MFYLKFFFVHFLFSSFFFKKNIHRADDSDEASEGAEEMERAYERALQVDLIGFSKDFSFQKPFIILNFSFKTKTNNNKIVFIFIFKKKKISENSKLKLNLLLGKHLKHSWTKRIPIQMHQNPIDSY